MRWGNLKISWGGGGLRDYGFLIILYSGFYWLLGNLFIYQFSLVNTQVELWEGFLRSFKTFIKTHFFYSILTAGRTSQPQLSWWILTWFHHVAGASLRDRPTRRHNLSYVVVKFVFEKYNLVHRVVTVGNPDKSPLQEERGYLIYSGNIASRGGCPQPT